MSDHSRLKLEEKARELIPTELYYELLDNMTELSDLELRRINNKFEKQRSKTKLKRRVNAKRNQY